MSELSAADFLRVHGNAIMAEGYYALGERLLAIADRLETLERALPKISDEICQTAGKALGYPWFKDDQKNFPGATEENGVCVGDHVAESIVEELANKYTALERENARLKDLVQKWRDTCTGRHGSQMPCVGRILP